MIQKLVWENVKHRPLRTFLSALLIAIPVTLVLMLAGLSKGMIEDATRRSRGVGADILMRPKSSNLMSLGSAPIDERLVGVIRKQPHVAVATGALSQSLGTPISFGAGIDLDALDRMSGGFVYLAGGPFRDADDVIVDEPYAREHKYHVGDSVQLINHRWRVSGIVEPGKLNRVFSL